MKDISKVEVSITLAVEEVNAVLVAVQELPAKIANPLTKKIKDQAESQIPQEAEVVENPQ